MKILIRGPHWLGKTSGYSSAMRDFFYAFENCNAKVFYKYFRDDQKIELFLKDYFSQTKGLFRKYWENTEYKGFDIIISFGTPMEVQPIEHPNHYIYTFWETDKIPGHRKLAGVTDWVNEFKKFPRILTCSEVTKKVFHDSGVESEIKILPWPQLEIEIYKQKILFRKKPGEIIFKELFSEANIKFSTIRKNYKVLYFSMGEFQPRKNFEELIMAYQLAFVNHNDVALCLKLSIGSHTDKKNEIEMFQELREYVKRIRGIERKTSIFVKVGYINQNGIYHLFKKNDYYITTTRGEGLGGPIVQSMLFGTPCIAHKFSVLQDYIKESNSIIYPYHLGPVKKMKAVVYDSFQNWAYFKIGDIVDSLKISRKLFLSNKKKYKEISKNAQIVTTSIYSLKNFKREFLEIMINGK